SSASSASTCASSRPGRCSTPAAIRSVRSSPRVDRFFTNCQLLTSIRLALEGGTGARGGAGLGRLWQRCVQPRPGRFGDVLTVDISLPDVEELHKLVAEGREKGFLSYDEIATACEDVELTKEQVEDFYTY